MKAVLAWVGRNPARTAAVVAVLIGWLGSVGVPDFVVAGLITIVGILIGGPAVHNVVSPVATVVKTTKAAAEKAAVDTAVRLTTDTVGVAGELTDTATGVAIGAAEDAADIVLKSIGVKRKDRSSR